LTSVFSYFDLSEDCPLGKISIIKNYEDSITDSQMFR